MTRDLPPLLQEMAPKDEHYPWRVMVCCILLNQTHGRQVRPMVDKLWGLVPDPIVLLVPTPDLEAELRLLLVPLGLVNKRMVALRRNATDYLRGVPLWQCYGMGPYGWDAIEIFVHGRTDLVPTDKWLLPYLEWRRAGGPPVNWKETT